MDPPSVTARAIPRLTPLSIVRWGKVRKSHGVQSGDVWQLVERSTHVNSETFLVQGPTPEGFN